MVRLNLYEVAATTRDFLGLIVGSGGVCGDGAILIPVFHSTQIGAAAAAKRRLKSMRCTHLDAAFS